MNTRYICPSTFNFKLNDFKKQTVEILILWFTFQVVFNCFSCLHSTKILPTLPHRSPNNLSRFEFTSFMYGPFGILKRLLSYIPLTLLWSGGLRCTHHGASPYYWCHKFFVSKKWMNGLYPTWYDKIYFRI